MGYFSNGAEGDIYADEYCSKCVHDNEKTGCPVWFLHMIHNYKECNNKDSMLHVLIPRNKDGSNQKCKMFYAKK